MATIRLKQLKNPPKVPPAQGTEAWCASKLSFLAPTLAKYKQLIGSDEFDEVLKEDYSTLSIDEAEGGRAALESALRKTVEAFGVNFPGYTSEVRFTDRVFTFPRLFDSDMLFAEAIPSCNQRPDTRLLYSMASGDCGNIQFFPLNAVRWLAPPRDIAALVTNAGRNRLTAELLHFGEHARPMQAEFYLLTPGQYRFTLVTATGKVQQGTQSLPSKALDSYFI